MNFDEFCNTLSSYRDSEIIFVGLGNRWRGDDAAGLIFVERLQDSPRLSGSHFILAGTNPENYLQKILDSDTKLVVFIDAASFGGQPGEMRWLDEDQIEAVGISTHAFSIKMVEQFLKAHKPLLFKYFGIQPGQTEFDQPVSPEVKRDLDLFFSPPTTPIDSL